MSPATTSLDHEPSHGIKLAPKWQPRRSHAASTHVRSNSSGNHFLRNINQCLPEQMSSNASRTGQVSAPLRFLSPPSAATRLVGERRDNLRSSAEDCLSVWLFDITYKLQRYTDTEEGYRRRLQSSSDSMIHPTITPLVISSQPASLYRQLNRGFSWWPMQSNP